MLSGTTEPPKNPRFPLKHYLAIWQQESNMGANAHKTSSAGAVGHMQMKEVAFKDLQQNGYIPKDWRFEDIKTNPAIAMDAGIAMTNLLADRFPALQNPMANALGYLKGGTYANDLIQKHGSINAARKAGALDKEAMTYLDNYGFMYHGIEDLSPAKGTLVYERYKQAYPNDVNKLELDNSKPEPTKFEDGGKDKNFFETVGPYTTALGGLATMGIPAVMSLLQNQIGQTEIETDARLAQDKASTYGIDRGMSGMVYAKMGSKMKVKHYDKGGEAEELTKPVPLVSLAPAQTVRDEMIHHGDNSITPTASKFKTHKEQDPDNVTDTPNVEVKDEAGNLISPAAYIFSNNPDLKIPKFIADMINFGMSPAYYQEGKKPIAPKEVKFSDYVFKGNKTEMTPAEIAKAVMKNLPVDTEPADMFARFRSQEHLKSREMFMTIARQLNELAKAKDAMMNGDNSGDTPVTDKQVPEYGYGGSVKKYGAGDKALEEALKLNSEFYKNLNSKIGFAGTLPAIGSALATGIQTAFTLGQDPTSEIYSPTGTQLQEAFAPEDTGYIADTVKQNLAQSEQNRIRSMENFGVSSTKAGNILSRDESQSYLNNAVMQSYLRNHMLKQKEAMATIENERNIVAQENQNKSDRNRYLGNLGLTIGTGVQNTANAVFNAQKYKTDLEAMGLKGMLDSAMAQKLFEQMANKTPTPAVPGGGDTNSTSSSSSAPSSGTPDNTYRAPGNSPLEQQSIDFIQQSRKQPEPTVVPEVPAGSNGLSDIRVGVSDVASPIPAPKINSFEVKSNPNIDNKLKYRSDSFGDSPYITPRPNIPPGSNGLNNIKIDGVENNIIPEIPPASNGLNDIKVGEAVSNITTDPALRDKMLSAVKSIFNLPGTTYQEKTTNSTSSVAPVNSPSYNDNIDALNNAYVSAKADNNGGFDSQQRIVEILNNVIGTENVKALMNEKGFLNIEFKYNKETGKYIPYIKGTNTPVIPQPTNSSTKE